MKHLLIIALLAATLSGCSNSSRPAAPPAVTPQQQASAAKSMGLTFPGDARFLFYHRMSENERFMPAPDDAVYLKIALSPASLDAILKQPPLSSAKWVGKLSNMHDSSDWPAWQPSKVKKFRFQQFDLPSAECLNVMIDDDNDEVKVVYLFWFQT